MQKTEEIRNQIPILQRPHNNNDEFLRNFLFNTNQDWGDMERRKEWLYNMWKDRRKMLNEMKIEDFNVPEIDWDNTYSSEPEWHHSHMLLSCIQDCFLTQHVCNPTRFRPGQVPSILNLLLTNEEDMI